MRDPQGDAFVASTAQFWDDIGALEKTVFHVVQSDQVDLPERVVDIRSALHRKNLAPEAMTERILDYATRLLAIPTRYPPSLLQTADEKAEIALLEQWMDHTARVVATERSRAAAERSARLTAAGKSDSTATSRWDSQPDVHRDFNERRDEILMESLTAAWFALYYLGVPFAQLWERVRRMADERGGYPSGACVTKFIGDLHRIARLEMARELRAINVDLADAVRRGNYKNTQTLILSYMPFGLFKELIHYNTGHLTPAAAHSLGNCYMLLQMRLYIRERFPIRYLVSRESLKQNWDNLRANPENNEETMFEGICEWMNRVFANNVYHQSVQLLTTNERVAGMATCVLGRQIGVYVLDTSRTSLPFAGNQLAGSLLLSYRAKLNSIERGDTRDTIELCGGEQAKGATAVEQAARVQTILRKVLMAA